MPALNRRPLSAGPWGGRSTPRGGRSKTGYQPTTHPGAVVKKPSKIIIGLHGQPNESKPYQPSWPAGGRAEKRGELCYALWYRASCLPLFQLPARLGAAGNSKQIPTIARPTPCKHPFLQCFMLGMRPAPATGWGFGIGSGIITPTITHRQTPGTQPVTVESQGILKTIQR